MPAILVSVDVEASGPCPLHGDMISFGAVVIEPSFSWQFESGNMRPECNSYSEEAYSSIGFSRLQHAASTYSITEKMEDFDSWCKSLKREAQADRLIMVSDNPGFDFQWINFECFNKIGYNPFGHSARRIGDVWGGLRARYYETRAWRRFRKTKHDHNPLNDALGNAEAWLEMWKEYGDYQTQKEIKKITQKFKEISEAVHIENIPRL